MAVGGMTSKEDRRRQKELEEARKAGIAEPEVCLYVSVYLCMYISRLPAPCVRVAG